MRNLASHQDNLAINTHVDKLTKQKLSRKRGSTTNMSHSKATGSVHLKAKPMLGRCLTKFQTELVQFAQEGNSKVIGGQPTGKTNSSSYSKRSNTFSCIDFEKLCQFDQSFSSLLCERKRTLKSNLSTSCL